MGLKYQFFVIKIPSDELLKRLLTVPGFTDATLLSRQYREWDEAHFKRLKEVGKSGGDYMPILKERPEDPELREYHEDTQSYTIDWFKIWWMTHPTAPEYVFGGYTDVGFLGSREMGALFWTTLMKAGINEWVHIGYHHGSNEGSIVKYTGCVESPATLSGREFEPRKSEREGFERYATRISKKTGYPLIQIHDYLNSLAGYGYLPWEHEVRNKLTKKSEVKP